MQDERAGNLPTADHFVEHAVPSVKGQLVDVKALQRVPKVIIARTIVAVQFARDGPKDDGPAEFDEAAVGR